ncbi:hypothetical protein HDU89_002124 [Geranomyces variabilis]|nr:hypothetical protein HDU89_002124 [Geranomyces variabilis]
MSQQRQPQQRRRHNRGAPPCPHSLPFPRASGRQTSKACPSSSSFSSGSSSSSSSAAPPFHPWTETAVFLPSAYESALDADHDRIADSRRVVHGCRAREAHSDWDEWLDVALADGRGDNPVLASCKQAEPSTPTLADLYADELAAPELDSKLDETSSSWWPRWRRQRRQTLVVGSTTSSQHSDQEDEDEMLEARYAAALSGHADPVVTKRAERATATERIAALIGHLRGDSRSSASRHNRVAAAAASGGGSGRGKPGRPGAPLAVIDAGVDHAQYMQ